MSGRDLYRTQVTLVLASLAAIVACSVHSLYFAVTRAQLCIDFAIIAFSTLGIVYADNLAVKLNDYFTRTHTPESAPQASD